MDYGENAFSYSAGYNYTFDRPGPFVRTGSIFDSGFKTSNYKAYNKVMGS